MQKNKKVENCELPIQSIKMNYESNTHHSHNSGCQND